LKYSFYTCSTFPLRKRFGCRNSCERFVLLLKFPLKKPCSRLFSLQLLVSELTVFLIAPSWLSPPAGVPSHSGLLPLVSPGPHGNLPSKATTEHDAVLDRPQPHSASLRSQSVVPQATPLRTASQPTRVAYGLGSTGPSPACFLGAQERPGFQVPSLLDVDAEGQRRDSTMPLCRVKSPACQASIYALEKDFLT
jgi:hypothetical protein